MTVARGNPYCARVMAECGLLASSAVAGPGEFVCPACGPAAGRAGRVRRSPLGFAIVTCVACQVEWQWPRPSPADLGEEYGREYYDSWALGEAEEAVRRMKLLTFDRLLAEVERQVPAGKLLDVGCATGFLLEAARRRGWDPFGVELSEYASSVARQRFGSERIVHGLLEEAAFAEESFRAITMTDLIEHVTDPVRTLRVAHRLLEPGGVLAITTPMVGSFSYRCMGRRWTHYKTEHLQYYRPEAIRRQLEAAEFRFLAWRGWPKCVTMEYVRAQFGRYRHWLISPLVQGACRILPPSLRAAPFFVPLGDMLVVARRER